MHSTTVHPPFLSLTRLPPCVEAEVRYGRSYATERAGVNIVPTHPPHPYTPYPPYIIHPYITSAQQQQPRPFSCSVSLISELVLLPVSRACLRLRHRKREPAASASAATSCSSRSSRSSSSCSFSYLCSAYLLSITVAVCALYLRGGCPSLRRFTAHLGRLCVWVGGSVLFAAASPGCSGPLSIQSQQSLA